MSKVGTHPYIREKMGANPVRSLLEVGQYTNYAHLRRKSQKVQNGSPIKCKRLPSYILVGSRQIVGSINQLGGIYDY